MSDLPPCPKCDSVYSYPDGHNYVCPECAHEWSIDGSDDAEEGLMINDANGNRLTDGDSVTVIKDL